MPESKLIGRVIVYCASGSQEAIEFRWTPGLRKGIVFSAKTGETIKNVNRLCDLEKEFKSYCQRLDHQEVLR
jgi:hypothetical protein